MSIDTIKTASKPVHSKKRPKGQGLKSGDRVHCPDCPRYGYGVLLRKVDHGSSCTCYVSWDDGEGPETIGYQHLKREGEDG